MTTLVTETQVEHLRRMVAEATDATYTDEDLIAYIEAYPHLDEYGEQPTLADGTANTEWTPTYDLHAAAADIWEEKAGAVAGKFDFRADGGDYTVSQQYEQYMKQCRYHRSRRMPSSARMVKAPEETSTDLSWIANLAEPDDV